MSLFLGLGEPQISQPTCIPKRPWSRSPSQHRRSGPCGLVTPGHSIQGTVGSMGSALAPRHPGCKRPQETVAATRLLSSLHYSYQSQTGLDRIEQEAGLYRQSLRPKDSKRLFQGPLAISGSVSSNKWQDCLLAVFQDPIVMMGKWVNISELSWFCNTLFCDSIKNSSVIVSEDSLYRAQALRWIQSL